MSYVLIHGFSMAFACALPAQALPDAQDQPPGAREAARTEEATERKPASQSQHPPEGEADREPREHLTAEDVLKALQRKRPQNRAISPAGPVTSGAGPDRVVTASGGSTIRRLLLPEGSPVVNRSGSLVRDGLWWTFVFEDDTEMPPVKLLPNAVLEPMVRTLVPAPRRTGTGRREKAGPTLRFEISGETTVFEGENYLLPRVAMRSTDVFTVPEQPDAAGEPAEPVPSAVDAASPPSTGLDAAPEDVLKLLQAQRPAQEAVRLGGPSSASAHKGDSSIASTGGGLIADGSPLVERAGRVIRRGNWWTFVFESDHPDHPEPPMKLLPSKSLELIVQTVERGTHPGQGPTPGLVFIISGQVSVFENENYLLPRVVRRRIDSGNLGK